MKFLKSPWQGYSQRKGRQGQTELLSYGDSLTNTTQDAHDTSIDGRVVLDHLTFTFQEDASVPAIRQKLIDLEVIPELLIEDIKGDAAGTVLRRVTANDVTVAGLHASVDEQGRGIVTVTIKCSKVKWERLTPDNTYAEAVWNPNDI